MIFALFLACKEEPPECTDELPCPFGEVCDAGVCKVIACSTSAQCGMEEYCVDRACAAGCGEDADCYPGDACDLGTNTCRPAGCRDTQLDCDYKEFCNPGNGECYEASDIYCKPCGDDSDCGGDNLCINIGEQVCGVTCESDADCPAAFDCLPITDGSNVISHQCLTYCWLYDEEESRMAAPPKGLPPLEDLVLTHETCDGGSL